MHLTWPEKAGDGGENLRLLKVQSQPMVRLEV